jgi:hypothetical protein
VQTNNVAWASTVRSSKPMSTKQNNATIAVVCPRETKRARRRPEFVTVMVRAIYRPAYIFNGILYITLCPFLISTFFSTFQPLSRSQRNVLEIAPVENRGRAVWRRRHCSPRVPAIVRIVRYIPPVATVTSAREFSRRPTDTM